MASVRKRGMDRRILVAIVAGLAVTTTSAFTSPTAFRLPPEVLGTGNVHAKTDSRCQFRGERPNSPCTIYSEAVEDFARCRFSREDTVRQPGSGFYGEVRACLVGGRAEDAVRFAPEKVEGAVAMKVMGGSGVVVAWLPGRGGSKAASTTQSQGGPGTDAMDRGWSSFSFAKAKGTPVTDSSGGDGGGRKGSRGSGGGGGGGDDGGSGGWRRSRRGESDGHAMASNSTASGAISVSNSYALDSGVEVDESLMKRSPLVRTFGPIVTFFRSRAGLYGMMLGYVVFTISQHITPAYLGMSFLTAIGPKTARRILVTTTQGLSLLTVASYIQDQFRHQVYPLPSVVSGPSAPYAVITGGSSGIGREIANELAARGYNLLLVSRGKDGLKRAAKEIREASREAAAKAKREREGNGSEFTKRETRGERRRRRRQEREEKKRLAARRSSEDVNDQSSNGNDHHIHHNNQSVEDNGHDNSGHEVGWGMGGGVVGEQATLDGDASPTRPLSPVLADAVTVRWLEADLSNSTAPAAVHNEVHRLNITVEILVNSAGVCRVGRVETLQSQDVEDQLNLNVVGTSLLTRLFAKDFAKRRTGRIMILSSATAVAPNPSVATYAASKSYLTSFAEALHSELEVFGVGVTCVMPGATTTNFEENSGARKALVWRLPLASMEPDEVAARSVEALMRGDRVIVPGWQNKIYMHVVAPVLPKKILMSFLEALWR